MAKKLCPKVIIEGCVVTLYRVPVKKGTDLAALGVRRDVNGRSGRRLTFSDRRKALAFFNDSASRDEPRYTHGIAGTEYHGDAMKRLASKIVKSGDAAA